MYNLLIVDDEELIRRGLRYAIKWDTIGFHAADEASDADEALEKLAGGYFHVMLTDIRMPGKNGLELIETVRALYPAVKVVIISGYSDFEYALTALKLTVEDYILKPIKKDNIETVFRGLREKLDRESADVREMKENAKMARKYVLMRLVNNDFRDKEELLETLRKREIIFEDKEYAVIALKLEKEDELVRSKFNGNHSLLTDALETALEPFPFTNVGGYYIALSDVDQTDSAVKKILTFLKDAACDEFLVGVGGKFTRLDYMSISYNEAIDAVASGRPGCVVQYRPGLRDAGGNHIRRSMLQKKMIDAMEGGNFAESLNLIEEIFSELRELDVNNAYNWCVNSLHEIVTYFNIQEMQEMSHIRDTDLADIIAKRDLNTVKNLYKKNVTNIGNILNNLAKEPALIIIEKAKKIVSEEYSDKNLTLSEIADRLNISYGYLSTVFKQLTGENFSNYVTSVRMANARKLLLNGSYKKYEIADKVGYASARYFTDTFKKHFGVSPTDYTTRLGRN